MSLASDMEFVKKYLPLDEFLSMSRGCSSEEGSYFVSKFAETADRINKTPALYTQDGLGDSAIAHLHYFHGESDWYILEKGEADESAFGFAILNGDAYCAELGYISIPELVRHGVELDLHFKPKPMSDIRKKHNVQPISVKPPEEEMEM